MKRTIFSATICALAMHCACAAMPSIPTLDYSNLITAIESTYKAVSFYNETISQTKAYINKMERFSKAIEKGDFDGINQGIKDSLSIVNDIVKTTQSLAMKCNEAISKSQIESKKATLRIIDMLTDLKGIKSLLDESESENASEEIKRIAQDVKKALELILKDHSETADEAIKQLNSSSVNMLRKIADKINEINDMAYSNADSVNVQNSLSSLLTQLIELRHDNDKAIASINELEAQNRETKDSIRQEINIWDNIGKQAEKSIAEAVKMRISVKKLRDEINGGLKNF